MKVYIVKHVNCDYEGTFERNVKAFSDKNKAKQYAQNAEREAIKISKLDYGSTVENIYDKEFNHWYWNELNDSYDVEELEYEN